MRLPLSFCLVFLLSALLGSSYTWAQTPAPLKFTADSIDVGRVSSGEEVISQLFEFRALQGVQIKDVTPDCGCSAASFPEDRLKKGQKNKIAVEFYPYTAGPFAKRFRIEFADSLPSQTLVLSGYIEPYNMSPQAMYPHQMGGLRFAHRTINLGTISKQGVIRKSVVFYNDSEVTVTFSEAPITPKHIGIAFDSPIQVAPKSYGSFQLYYHPELRETEGHLLDNIRLKTDSEKQPIIDLTVAATMGYVSTAVESEVPAPRLRIPVVVELGKVKLAEGQGIPAQLQVSNLGNLDLRIERTAVAEGVEFVNMDTNLLQPLQSSTLRFTVLDNGQKGAQKRTVTIHTNDPQMPEAQVTFSFEVL